MKLIVSGGTENAGNSPKALNHWITDIDQKFNRFVTQFICQNDSICSVILFNQATCICQNGTTSHAWSLGSFPNKLLSRNLEGFDDVYLKHSLKCWM